MTNEEAIAWLEHHFDPLPDGTKQSEVVSLAIKALETIPKYKDAYNKGWDDGAKATYEHLKMCEEEQSGDLISRDELLKAIDTWDKFGCDADTKLVPYQDHYIPYIHYDDVIKCIKGMPSVNPQEPKTDVLDKIRTEIEELADADGYGDYQLGFSFGLMMAMEIIDKYREEGSRE